MTPIWQTTNLIAINHDGEFLGQFVLPDVLDGVGFALDPNATDILYVLDDRSDYANLMTDAEQTEFLDNKNYFVLLKYQLVGGNYSILASTILPGADHGTGNHNGSPQIDFGNPCAVVDGEVWVTRTPLIGTFNGGYFRWSGGAVTVVTFAEEVEPVGSVVQVADKPAPRQSLFATTLNDELIRFDTGGAILERVEIVDASRLPMPIAVCNRLMAVHGFGSTRTEDEGIFPIDGGGGGEEQ